MDKIKLVIDSTCDLPKEIIEEYDIEVLPVLINFGEDSYLDGVEIQLPEMLERIDRENVLPTTAQVIPTRFINCYKKYLDEGYKILSLHLSSHMSGTYQSACIAKEELESDDIVVIDSMSVTMGYGIIIYKAARMIREGKSISEIEAELLKYKDKIRSGISFDSLDNLVRGGRLSKSKAMFVSALGIKLLLNIQDGEMNVLGKVRGNKKIVKEILDRFKNTSLKPGEPVILMNFESEDVYPAVKQYLEENNIDYIYSTVGCSVGIHSGSKVCALFYVEDYK